MAPIVVIIFNFVLEQAALPPSTARAMIIGLMSLLIYFLGLGLALLALTRLRAEGRKGILAPAIVGLLINALFVLLMVTVMISSFNTGRSRAEMQGIPANPSGVEAVALRSRCMPTAARGAVVVSGNIFPARRGG